VLLPPPPLAPLLLVLVPPPLLLPLLEDDPEPPLEEEGPPPELVPEPPPPGGAPQDDVLPLSEEQAAVNASAAARVRRMEVVEFMVLRKWRIEGTVCVRVAERLLSTKGPSVQAKEQKLCLGPHRFGDHFCVHAYGQIPIRRCRTPQIQRSFALPARFRG
jgi:hypothetical protein